MHRNGKGIWPSSTSVYDKTLSRNSEELHHLEKEHLPKIPLGNNTSNEKLIHTFPLDWNKAKVFLLTTLFHIVLEILAHAVGSLSFYLPLTCQQNSGEGPCTQGHYPQRSTKSMGWGGGRVGVGWGQETRVFSVSHYPRKPHKHLFTKRLHVHLHVNCLILAEVPTCPPQMPWNPQLVLGPHRTGALCVCN